MIFTSLRRVLIEQFVKYVNETKKQSKTWCEHHETINLHFKNGFILKTTLLP